LTTPCVKSCQFAATAKLSAFNQPNLHLVPTFVVTPFEFCQDFQRQKTIVSGISCGVVCVILRLAVSAEHRFVTDGRTDTQWQLIIVAL